MNALSSGASRRRGFTLLEMLVTMVLVSLLAALLGQAMFQLGRIERLLAGTQLDGLAQSVRVSWVRALIDGTVPGHLGSTDRFKATERRISGLSVAVPDFPDSTAERYELALLTSSDGTKSRLVLIRQRAEGHTAVMTLLEWPGREGRFRFLAEDDQWLTQWPPDQAQAPVLPLAVSIETGLEGYRTLIVAPRARDDPLQPRRVVEQL